MIEVEYAETREESVVRERKGETRSRSKRRVPLYLTGPKAAVMSVGIQYLSLEPPGWKDLHTFPNSYGHSIHIQHGKEATGRLQVSNNDNVIFARSLKI